MSNAESTESTRSYLELGQSLVSIIDEHLVTGELLSAKWEPSASYMGMHDGKPSYMRGPIGLQGSQGCTGEAETEQEKKKREEREDEARKKRLRLSNLPKREFPVRGGPEITLVFSPSAENVRQLVAEHVRKFDLSECEYESKECRVRHREHVERGECKDEFASELAQLCAENEAKQSRVNDALSTLYDELELSDGECRECYEWNCKEHVIRPKHEHDQFGELPCAPTRSAPAEWFHTLTSTRTFEKEGKIQVACHAGTPLYKAMLACGFFGRAYPHWWRQAQCGEFKCVTSDDEE